MRSSSRLHRKERDEGDVSARASGSRVAIGCGLVLTACATSRTDEPPVRTKTYLQAEGDLNPIATGRASPVVVRVFELKSDAEFSAADFYALYEREKETLGSSLLSRQEYVLKPGQTRTSCGYPCRATPPTSASSPRSATFAAPKWRTVVACASQAIHRRVLARHRTASSPATAASR